MGLRFAIMTEGKNEEPVLAIGKLHDLSSYANMSCLH